MKFITTILFSLFPLLSFANEYKLLEKSFDGIRKAQPQRRKISGYGNLIFGSLAVSRGIKVYQKSIYPENHKKYALTMTSTGLLMLINSVADLFYKSAAENALAYYDDNINGDTRITLSAKMLKISARKAFWNRMYQSTVTGITAYTYYYMWRSEFIEHKALVFPAGFLAGLTLLKIIWKTPQEQAYDYFKYHKKIARHRVITFNTDFIPLKGGFLQTFNFTF